MDDDNNLRRFDFARDSFAFPNELLWEYLPDPVAGKMHFRRREPRPSYAHRCFVLTRAARLFQHHARFDPALPRLDEAAYLGRVRAVLARSPRRVSAPEGRILLPGYAGLRQFSSDWETMLKAECGGAWRSYVLRSHWRMVFPIPRGHQFRTARSLTAALQRNTAPIVHLVKFPALTINHGMVVFDQAESPAGLDFSAYDPNEPAHPARLSFDRSTSTFSMGPNSYWAGGALDVIEIYRHWLM